MLPLGLMAATSVGLGPLSSEGGISLDGMLAVWSSPSTYEVLATTLVFAVGSLALALLVGVGFAFLVERTDTPLRGFAYVAVPLTIAMPGMLYGIAWVLLLSPEIGLLNKFLMALFGAEEGLVTGWLGLGLIDPPFDAYTLPSMTVVEGLRLGAVVFLMTVGVFRNMDATLEEAAIVSGVAPWRVAVHISMRLMLPGILAAAIYVFTSGMEAFEVPAIMGMPVGMHTLSTKIYLLSTTADYVRAAALGVLFIFLAVVLVFAYRRATGESVRYATVRGRAFRARPFGLGRWRLPAAAVIVVYFAIVVCSPLFIMIWASIQPYYRLPTIEALGDITFNAYVNVLTHPYGLGAVGNSILVTFLAPAIAIIFAALIAWFAVRTQYRGRRVLDVLAFLPHAVPSTILALGFIYLFLAPPANAIPIYGTAWIIALALGIRYLAFSSRSMNSALVQVHRELEEAAQTAGITWLRVMRHIVWPLLMPTVVATWAFVALNSVRDATFALMLASNDGRVLPMLMWDNWQSGHVPEAAATGVLLLLAILLILGSAKLFDYRRNRRLSLQADA